jgi:hypothetical protein
MTNNDKKIELGQFFTKDDVWLKPQVREFILNSGCSVAYDPFAGEGDLLDVAKNELGFQSVKGLDIDPDLQWTVNDSLTSIPHVPDAIIITNPPYLSKSSASRKKIDMSKYFDDSIYSDAYLIALDRMLAAQDHVVAIIPESFINSNFRRKDMLYSISILEDNPFEDTDAPVCVSCFDGKHKGLDEVSVYKNETRVGDLDGIMSIKAKPTNSIIIKFNDKSGWLGLRAADSSDDRQPIRFDYKSKIDYDWDDGIKESSRHFSLISIDVPAKKRSAFIKKCNDILHELRKASGDVILTPFMGNTKAGVRRRRLDFKLARAIMEKAYAEVMGATDEDQS